MHFLHGSFIMLPVPLQESQVTVVIILPIKVSRLTLTWPLPWQTLQATIPPSILLPLPLHSSHMESTEYSSSFFIPKADSLNSISVSSIVSEPLLCLLPLVLVEKPPSEPPPKNILKISPKPNSEKTLLKFISSNKFLLKPYWSYCLLFSSLLSTA